MFEARFAQAKIFKHLIDALGELGELGDLEHNFNLYCSNDGITIQDIILLTLISFNVTSPCAWGSMSLA